jgi:PadR family transcriptional regulator, regulatory protein PadR
MLEMFAAVQTWLTLICGVHIGVNLRDKDFFCDEVHVNEKSTAEPHLRPSGDMLTAHLLALLKGWSAYGYELAQRLEEAGLGELNKGSIYRMLRQMERSGLVSSSWDTSSDGPARRVYDMTAAGKMFLDNWLAFIDAHRRGLEELAGLAAAAHAVNDGANAAGPGRAKQGGRKKSA